MRYVLSFLGILFTIDIVWKTLEIIIDGHLTVREVDFYIGLLWAGSLTYALRDKL